MTVLVAGNTLWWTMREAIIYIDGKRPGGMEYSLMDNKRGHNVYWLSLKVPSEITHVENKRWSNLFWPPSALT